MAGMIKWKLTQIIQNKPRTGLITFLRKNETKCETNTTLSRGVFHFILRLTNSCGCTLVSFNLYFHDFCLLMIFPFVTFGDAIFK